MWDENSVTAIDISDYTLSLSEKEGGSHKIVFYMWNTNIDIYCTLSGGGDVNGIMDNYNSTAIYPTLNIFNQSWSLSKEFTYTVDGVWLFSLPSSELWVRESEWLSREQWFLQAELTDSGTNSIIRSELSSLLHASTEPLLQWSLGAIKDGPNDLTDDSRVILKQSPCAPDVAVLLPTKQINSAIIIGVTISAKDKKTTWYNIKTEICPGGGGCGEVLDIVFTSYRLLVLTTKALHISADMQVKNSNTHLNYTTIPLDDLNSDCSSVSIGHLNYVPFCQSRHHDVFRQEIVTLVIECNEMEALFSSDTFISWQNLDHTLYPDNFLHVLDVIYNYHVHSMTVLYNTTDGQIVLDVRLLGELDNVFDSEPFFPTNSFSGATFSKLRIHPLTHILYVFSDEILECLDGGNLCEVVYSMANMSTLEDLFFNKHDNSIVGVSSIGSILYSKSGYGRFVELDTTIASSDSIFMDHLGYIYVISLHNDKLEKNPIVIDTELNSLSIPITNPLVIQQMAGREAVIMEYTSGTTPQLSKRNRGQVLTSYSGGSALVLDTSDKTQYSASFGIKMKLALLTSYHTTSSGNTPAILYTLAVNNIVNDTGETILELLNVPALNVGWQESDLNNTVMVPGTISFLLTGYINNTHMEAMATGFVSMDIERMTRQWFMFNMSEGMTLTEGPCKHQMTVDPAIGKKRMFTLDVDDQISLYVLANTTEYIPHQRTNIVYATLSIMGKLEFRLRSELSYIPFHQNLSVSIKNYLLTKSVVALRTHIPTASLRCSDITPVFTFFSGCPCTKHLAYYYPVNITREDFLGGMPTQNGTDLLKQLPTNYRPPSQLGIGIPISQHTYNADPSKPFPRNTFSISRETQRYGQCVGKDSKEACECTEEMKYSADAEFSDCREKVFRLQERSIVRPMFAILEKGRDPRPLTIHDIITLHEVNSRDPPVTLQLSSVTLNAVNEDPFLAGTDIFMDPTGIAIALNGSELFHYRAKLLDGSSHCSLQVEFQLYVDNAPIAYPLEYILKFSMAIVIGLVLFVVYLWYLSEHHTFRRRRIGPLCPELSKIGKQNIHLPSAR